MRLVRLSVLSLLCIALLSTLPACVHSQPPTTPQLPGVPFVAPIASALYSSPNFIAGVQGGLGVTPALYSANLFSQQQTEAVFFDSATGAHQMSADLPYVITALEPRPHGALVWGMGFVSNRTSAFRLQGTYAVMAFDATTLQLARTFPQAVLNALTPPPFANLNLNYTTSSQARWGIATDSQGRVYISAAYQMYVLNPTTGAQLGYFSLPNNDTLQVFPATSGAPFHSNEQNYAFAFNAQDELWIVDPNIVAPAPPGVVTLYHTTSSGVLLDYGQLTVTPAGASAVATFSGIAVDSAGAVYIAVTYSAGLDTPVLLRVQLLHSVVSVASTLALPLPSPYVLPTSTRLSISWGATPAQDAIYVTSANFGYMVSQVVYVLDPTGAVRASFNPSHGFGYANEAVYDAYLDSFVVTQYFSPHQAIRVARNLSIIATYDLPNIPLYRDTLYTGSVAVDGTGRTFIAASNNTDSFVWVFNAAQQLETTLFIGTGDTLALGNGLLYIPNPDTATVIDTYSASAPYRFMGSLTLPALRGASQLSFIASGSAGSLWGCNGTDAMTAVDLATLQVTVPYSGNGSMFRFTQFAAVPQLGVLYLGATQTTNSRYPIFLAVSLRTGAILAVFDAGEPGPATSAYSPSYALAADPLGVLWVPDVAAGVRVFASQAAATVKGHGGTPSRAGSQLPA